MVYSPEVRAEVKKMFVLEGRSAKYISGYFKGKPSLQTIMNWANDKNKEGKNWFDEREEYELQRYEQISPKGLANKILQKINFLLNKDDSNFSVKDADALAKLRVALERITDRKYQIPMMYEMLTDLTTFLREHYPKLANQELVNAIRHFKNTLKERLG